MTMKRPPSLKLHQHAFVPGPQTDRKGIKREHKGRGHDTSDRKILMQAYSKRESTAEPKTATLTKKLMGVCNETLIARLHPPQASGETVLGLGLTVCLSG